MYSLVLMMALTPSTDTASFGRGGCSGCWGCNGCYGCSGCYGCHGCHGCRGGWGLFGKRHGCHGCYGCHGCHGCNGCHGCHGCHGCCGGAAPAAPEKAPAPPVEEKKPAAAIPAPATLVVTLPADAKLSIDGNATRSTNAVRTFVTPILEAGKDFSYTLKAEVVRDGQTFTATKQVTVQAGRESRIVLDIPQAAVAQR